MSERGRKINLPTAAYSLAIARSSVFNSPPDKRATEVSRIYSPELPPENDYQTASSRPGPLMPIHRTVAR